MRVGKFANANTHPGLQVRDRTCTEPGSHTHSGRQEDGTGHWVLPWPPLPLSFSRISKLFQTALSYWVGFTLPSLLGLFPARHSWGSFPSIFERNMGWHSGGRHSSLMRLWLHLMARQHTPKFDIFFYALTEAKLVCILCISVCACALCKHTHPVAHHSWLADCTLHTLLLMCTPACLGSVSGFICPTPGTGSRRRQISALWVIVGTISLNWIYSQCCCIIIPLIILGLGFRV